jgi:glycosyltransferase involved in cell wall biosynthesis
MLLTIPEPAVLADDRWTFPGGRGRRGDEILGIGRFAREVLARLPAFETVPRTLPVLHPLEPLWLAAIIVRRRPDVYFSPGFNPPLWSPVPIVFTVWDLIHLHAPNEGSGARNAYYRYVVRPAVRRAARVLTGTKFWRSEIATWAAIPTERIEVAGAGVGPQFGPDGPPHDPGFPYILYVGNRKPHKNLPRLLEAFWRSRLAPHVRLVLTGPPDKETVRAVGALGLGKVVQFAGAIPEEKLPEWYRGAAAVAQVSLYEGFGLPALEAMACGVPVVAADATSLPEVVGDAAILVDPKDADAIADGLQRAMADEELRQELRTRGLERARHFTWEMAATVVDDALCTASGGRGRYP